MRRNRARRGIEGVLVAVGTSALVLGTYGTVASAATETMMLDTYSASNTPNPSVSTAAAVPNNTARVVTASGTYSRWIASSWTETQYHFVCGTPEGAPTTPSPGTTNGPVGTDAQTGFADVRSFISSPPCSTSPALLGPTFQIDTGTGYAYVTPVGGSGHSYTYHVFATGVPMSFRIVDGSTDDNYGVLTVTQRPFNATELCALTTQWANRSPGSGQNFATAACNRLFAADSAGTMAERNKHISQYQAMVNKYTSPNSPAFFTASQGAILVASAPHI